MLDTTSGLRCRSHKDTLCELYLDTLRFQCAIPLGVVTFPTLVVLKSEAERVPLACLFLTLEA